MHPGRLGVPSAGVGGAVGIGESLPGLDRLAELLGGERAGQVDQEVFVAFVGVEGGGGATRDQEAQVIGG
jgi:hypothetical protein